jgi:hypothetical protein
MAVTKSNQWKTVVEGLAVACVAIGATSFPSSKSIGEFAFSYAWRRWAYAGQFPSVDPDDFFIYVGKSAGRVGAKAAFEWERALRPYIFENFAHWGAEEVLDFVAEFSDVPASGWEQLARAFVEDVDRQLSRIPR